MNHVRSIPGRALRHEEQCRQLAARIVASREFVRATRQRDFLLYVVDRMLCGFPEDVTETLIGHRVYGRPASYRRRRELTSQSSSISPVALISRFSRPGWSRFRSRSPRQRWRRTGLRAATGCGWELHGHRRCCVAWRPKPFFLPDSGQSHHVYSGGGAVGVVRRGIETWASNAPSNVR